MGIKILCKLRYTVIVLKILGTFPGREEDVLKIWLKVHCLVPCLSTETVLCQWLELWFITQNSPHSRAQMSSMMPFLWEMKSDFGWRPEKGAHQLTAQAIVMQLWLCGPKWRGRGKAQGWETSWEDGGMNGTLQSLVFMGANPQVAGRETQN